MGNRLTVWLREWEGLARAEMKHLSRSVRCAFERSVVAN